jgi:two-component system CheB/CheR fusion protein
MTSLKAYLQLISRYSNDNIPDQFTMLIAKASGSLNKLEILVNDLLDVSKIQAGKLNFSKTKVEVSSLVRICVENAGYMFPDFKLIFDAEDDFFVLGNQERLEQVVMNMISNAVKYSPENLNAFIKVTADGSMVRIAVTDYGIGMTELQLEKIFDRFYRVDEASVMAGGLGMGLYICEEIVKSHEGKMGVISNFGQGSTFYVLLPLIS